MKKILFSFCIAFVAFVFSACNSSSSPEGVVKEYIECVKSGNYEKIVDLMHFKKELSDSDKEQLVSLFRDKVSKSLEEKQGIASFSIDDVTLAEGGESATVKYTINYGDGTSKTEEGDVVKVDDKWMIDTGK